MIVLYILSSIYALMFLYWVYKLISIRKRMIIKYTSIKSHWYMLSDEEIKEPAMVGTHLFRNFPVLTFGIHKSAVDNGIFTFPFITVGWGLWVKVFVYGYTMDEYNKSMESIKKAQQEQVNKNARRRNKRG